MTYGSKNSANGSKTHSGKSLGKQGANMKSNGMGAAKPSSSFHEPSYVAASTSNKTSNMYHKSKSQPGINPKGSQRVA